MISQASDTLHMPSPVSQASDTLHVPCPVTQASDTFHMPCPVARQAETTGKKKLKIPSGLVLWATDQGSVEEQSVEAKPFKALTVPWKLTARTKVYVENFTWATRGGGADGEDKKDDAKDDGEDKKDGDKDECEDKPELDFVSLGDMNKVLNHLEAPRNGKAVWCGEGLDDVKVYGAALDTALQTHFATWTKLHSTQIFSPV